MRGSYDVMFHFRHLNINSLLAGVNVNQHILSQLSKLDELHNAIVIDGNFEVIALTVDLA